jgi:6,7-dimethyl-8-ribityllumazine synthase
MKFGVVAAKFNKEIVDKLLEGALTELEGKGSIEVIRVPGAFEIPLACLKLCKQGGFDGIVALGAVIRGDTYHFEVVSDSCANGVMRVSLDFAIPIGFGVITTDTEEQAWERAGGAHGNKGRDAARAMLDML